MELPIFFNNMKEFFSYEQQLDKLSKQPNLTISDEKSALEYLKYDGYYNIVNGYARFFRQENRLFYPNTDFKHIVKLYRFDKKLSAILYEHIMSAECRVKSIISHIFSKYHGIDDKQYLTVGCFAHTTSNIHQIERLIADLQRTIARGNEMSSNKYRGYIAHYSQSYSCVPFWVLVRAITFGTVTMFYKFMRKQEKEQVAMQFGADSQQFDNILSVAVEFRNIVAHGDPLFCTQLNTVRLQDNLKIVKSLSIPRAKHRDFVFGKKDFLSLLIVLKYLLANNDYANLIHDVEHLLVDLQQSISPVVYKKVVRTMGLDFNNWKKLPQMKKNQ